MDRSQITELKKYLPKGSIRELSDSKNIPYYRFTNVLAGKSKDIEIIKILCDRARQYKKDLDKAMQFLQ
jgi:hypothetical protein